MIKLLLALAGVLLLTNAWAAPAIEDRILPVRERAAWIDQTMQKRVEVLLPGLMQASNIDMWLLISREYNEDPVLRTMLPAEWLNARRTTILAFVRSADGSVKAFAIAPYKVGSVFEKAWDKPNQPDQWKALNNLIEKFDPARIGINESAEWAHADGLVAGDKQRLLEALPQKYQQRLVSAEPLAVGWLEQRIPIEVEQLKNMGAIAHQIIAEGFSNQVIVPGTTTTEDVVWWFRERVLELKLQTWFHPSVSLQRSDKQKFDHEDSFTNGYGDQVIQPGDLLHVDFGITYLRLNTDTQQHAYVLLEGQKQAPEYLTEALHRGNRLQDIFTGLFAVGKTGNEVLKQAREKAISEGLKPSIYTHPIGYHGHAAGTTLGMWDSQGGVPGDGDYPLHLNTAYSIELNNAMFIDAWDKEIRIMLEEDAFFDKTGVWYWDGRQTELLLVRSD